MPQVYANDMIQLLEGTNDVTRSTITTAHFTSYPSNIHKNIKFYFNAPFLYLGFAVTVIRLKVNKNIMIMNFVPVELQIFEHGTAHAEY